MKAEKAKQDKTKSDGSFYNTLFSRNSKTLTSSIISAAFEGRLLYRDAARMLNVKVSTLDNVAVRLGLR